MIRQEFYGNRYTFPTFDRESGCWKVLQEQHRKRNSLRLNGVAENDNENPLDIVKSEFHSHRGISCSTMDIAGVDVIREEVINARRALKDSGLSAYEDLTKHRYDLLIAAKKKLGDNQAWYSNGVYLVCP
ncbi:hypothetical protein JTB14_009441 [Gonioctena quinquepunctata]|nr:hypothetical protein JTB14_009441 [Gonioctena quinquepunctata]